MSRFCTACGRPTSPGARFCEECGQNLDGPESSDVQPSSQALSVAADAPPPVRTPAPAEPPHRSPPNRVLRRRRTVALLSMVAVLSAGAGVYVGLPRSPAGAAEGPSSPGSTPGPSPSTTATAAEGSELRRIAPLLQQSARARTSIENAVNEAGACQLAPDQATSIMKKAIITRQDDVGQVEALPAAPIGNGQALLGDLLQALRESSTADQDFITWIDDTAGAGACPLGTDSAWQAGDQESALALAAKTKFVALWNPLARQYALPTFSANDI